MKIQTIILLLSLIVATQAADIVIDLTNFKEPNATISCKIGDTLHIISNDTQNSSRNFAIFAGDKIIWGPGGANQSSGNQTANQTSNATANATSNQSTNASSGLIGNMFQFVSKEYKETNESLNGTALAEFFGIQNATFVEMVPFRNTQYDWSWLPMGNASQNMSNASNQTSNQSMQNQTSNGSMSNMTSNASMPGSSANASQEVQGQNQSSGVVANITLPVEEQSSGEEGQGVSPAGEEVVADDEGLLPETSTSDTGADAGSASTTVAGSRRRRFLQVDDTNVTSSEAPAESTTEQQIDPVPVEPETTSGSEEEQVIAPVEETTPLEELIPAPSTSAPPNETSTGETQTETAPATTTEQTSTSNPLAITQVPQLTNQNITTLPSQVQLSGLTQIVLNAVAVGNVNLTATDLELNVAGIPITLDGNLDLALALQAQVALEIRQFTVVTQE